MDTILEDTRENKTLPIGQGQGAGLPRREEGGRDQCVCPECDKVVTHQRGIPCTQQKCPDCGSRLIGK